MPRRVRANIELVSGARIPSACKDYTARARETNRCQRTVQHARALTVPYAATAKVQSTHSWTGH